MTTENRLNGIALTRVRNIPRNLHGSQEEDFTWYEYREGGYLARIFVKVMYDTKRVYIDRAPDTEAFIEDHYDWDTDGEYKDKALERHDEEDTLYIDFADFEDYCRRVAMLKIEQTYP